MAKTSIVQHKQYATYQACFDIYSDSLSNIDVYKKVFLIIIEWLKGRIGDTSDAISELKKYPFPSNYKSFDIKDMFGFKITSQMDIRLFNLEEENSWAMRIDEPDNRAEFKSGSMADSSSIYGRSFITDIGLKNCEDSIISLAVKITCKEPINNNRDAVSFRPAFIKSIYLDRELEICEHGVNKQFQFLKEYIDDEVIGKAITVDKDNSDAFIKELFLNKIRQMPIIICPHKVYETSYISIRYIEGERIELKADINHLSYSLLGYAHVVVLSDDVTDWIFQHKKLHCSEYGDVLKDECIIFHKDIDADTGLPDEPVYSFISDSEEDENALLKMEKLSKKYSVRKVFSFSPVKFYRELKKEYYSIEGENHTKEVVDELENLVQEKEQTINDLTIKLGELDKETKKRIDEFKIKFHNSQTLLNDYKCRYEKLQNDAQIYEFEKKRLTSDYEEKIRQKDMMINILGGARVKKADSKVMSIFYGSLPKSLFALPEIYKEVSVKKLIKDKLIDYISNIYHGLNREFRRYELLEIILQYNDYLDEIEYDSDGLIYYPDAFEFYDGEFKDVIYDVIYEGSDLEMIYDKLLTFNEFNYSQEDKKKEIMSKINGYRKHQNIKGVLGRIGFELKSSSNHYVYCYYGDERYKITVAGSPSDTNAGKNLAERIIELCL
ncbi:MAG: hypothetical protein K6B68_17765 [Eubacterium sp.]|nr:hypothetical protein [Eubacterium sp.]